MHKQNLLSRFLDRLFGLVIPRSSSEGESDTRSVVHSIHAPPPIGPYAQAILSRGLVFCSGQIGIDPLSGELVGGGIREETRQVIENIHEVLKSVGCSLDDVVQTTVYLTDLEDYERFNTVYADFFHASTPSRAAVQVSSLPRKAQVEISCIAALPESLSP